MRTPLVICAIIVSVGSVSRFVTSFYRKKPFSLMLWSLIELIAVAILFDHFAIGA